MTQTGMQATWRGAVWGDAPHSRPIANTMRRRLSAWLHALRSDEHLMKMARRGDSVAYDVLVKRFQNRIYAMVLTSVGDPERAADMVCEVFVTAYRRIDGAATCRAWTWFHLHAVAAVIKAFGGGQYGFASRASW